MFLKVVKHISNSILVRPKLKYYFTVWNPYTHKNIERSWQFGSFQRIMPECLVNSMDQAADKHETSLHKLCSQANRLILLYMITHNLIDTDQHTNLHKPNSECNRNTQPKMLSISHKH